MSDNRSPLATYRQPETAAELAMLFRLFLVERFGESPYNDPMDDGSSFEFGNGVFEASVFVVDCDVASPGAAARGIRDAGVNERRRARATAR